MIAGEPTLGEFLDQNNLGAASVFTFPFSQNIPVVRWHKFGTPPDETRNTEDRIVPALQVITVGSEVIDMLNQNPFNDDVVYASIVGDHEVIEGIMNSFRWYSPAYESLGPNTKEYFPWIRVLDGGDGESDAIVPVWSQTIATASQSATFASNHISYAGIGEVRNQIRDWLNDDSLLNGDQLRMAFQNQQIENMASRNNVCVGSELVNGISIGGGVNRDGTVKVEFSGITLDLTGTNPKIPNYGGLVEVTCTGMVQGTNRTIDIVTDGTFDGDLHTGIAIPYSGSGELQPFSVTGYICQDNEGEIVGKDGKEDDNDRSYDIGFEINNSAEHFTQSPPSAIGTSDGTLDVLEGPETLSASPASTTYTAKGGVIVKEAPGVNQSTTLWIYHDALINKLLVEETITFTVPNNAFSGRYLLLPYDIDFDLHVNSNGDVAGSGGSSGETSANIFQKIDDPLVLNRTSNNKTISDP